MCFAILIVNASTFRCTFKYDWSINGDRMSTRPILLSKVCVDLAIHYGDLSTRFICPSIGYSHCHRIDQFAILVHFVWFWFWIVLFDAASIVVVLLLEHFVCLSCPHSLWPASHSLVRARWHSLTLVFVLVSSMYAWRLLLCCFERVNLPLHNSLSAGTPRDYCCGRVKWLV